MRKETSLLARLLALLAALTFVALLTISIIAFATQRQFFRAAPYTGALQAVNAYDRAPGVIAELFVTSLDGEGRGLAGQLPLPELNQPDVELFLSILLSRDWLQAQSEVIVRRTIDELNGEAPTQPAVISLVDLKERLGGTAGRDALLAVINTRPACGPADLGAFTCGFDLAGEISCRPPSLNLELCGTVIDLAVAGFVSQIPDEVDLDVVLRASEPFSAPLRNHARAYVSLISVFARFGWLAAIPFLLLATVLAVRSLAGWLRWWGAPLVGVALGLLPVISVTVLWPTWYVSAPLQELAVAAPALAVLVSDVASVLSRGLVLQLSIAAFLMGATGLGMLALSFLAPLVQRWVSQG